MITLWALLKPRAPPQRRLGDFFSELGGPRSGGHHFSDFPDKEGTTLATEHVTHALLLHNASTRAHFVLI